jgi:hypothetical protein
VNVPGVAVYNGGLATNEGYASDLKGVIVLIGGQIGQAIARRVGVGKHILLADMPSLDD